MNLKRITILTLTLVFGVSINFFGPANGSALLSKADLEKGKKLYQINCASCHGVNLEGQPNWQTPNPDGTYPAPPHDKTGHTWHHDDLLLFNYTKFGGEKALSQLGVTDFKSGMPGFEDSLEDSEIRLILRYIKTTWPVEIRVRQQSRNKK